MGGAVGQVQIGEQQEHCELPQASVLDSRLRFFLIDPGLHCIWSFLLNVIELDVFP
jgi:hypothetical protein